MSNGPAARRLSIPPPPLPCEPDVSQAHKTAVTGALRWAWAQLSLDSPETLASGAEEEITAKLQEALNEHGADGRRKAPGLASFETVDRGPKVTTADDRIEKAPDLVFRPPPLRGVRNRTHWGVFAECKIVDGPTRLERYCTQGVARFTDGEYCARMPSGAMVAYVRNATLPFPSLEPKLRGRFQTASHRAGPTADVSLSGHTRGSLTPPCVDIELLHLWLRVV